MSCKPTTSWSTAAAPTNTFDALAAPTSSWTSPADLASTFSACCVGVVTPPIATAATDILVDRLTANWEASADATSYRLDVSTVSSFVSYVSGYQDLNVGNVLTAVVTGLASDTDYFYRVRAVNDSGTSEHSNTITATTTVVTQEWWRLNITAVNDVFTSIAELEFRATPGGADQANGGTATASSWFDGVASPPSKAFDNNAGVGSSWLTLLADTPPQWISYHFLTPVSVQQISITVYTGSWAPKSWDIQYSADGVSWTTAWSVADQTGWTNNSTRVFTAP